MSETLPDDLQVRILRLLNGELGDEDVIRLDAELRASREARALFIQLRGGLGFAEALGLEPVRVNW